CYPALIAGARPGGRINRLRRMRHPTSRTRWRAGRRCPSTSGATTRATPPSRPRIRELGGRDTVGTAATAFVGIDVSRAILDRRPPPAHGKRRPGPPPLTPAARASVARAVRLPGREAGAMPAAAGAPIAGTPARAADRELPVGISGVGPQTASTVPAGLPRLD